MVLHRPSEPAALIGQVTTFPVIGKRQLDSRCHSVDNRGKIGGVRSMKLTALFGGLGVIAKATADRAEENESNISLTESLRK
jgi:hypothetical protein